MTKKKIIYTIVASFFMMLIMAITENSKGVLIPTFKSEFGVSDTAIGFYLLLVTLSFVVATFFAGEYIKKHGQKNTILLGIAVAGSGFLIITFTHNFWQFVLVYTCLTVGISFIGIGLNTMIPLLKVVYLSVVMNTMHFFYGVGGTIAHRTTGFLLKYNITWQEIFLFFSLMYLIAFIIYFFAEQPEMKEHDHKHSKVKSFEWPLIILFGIGLGFYVTAEIQTANWLVNYLNEMYQYSENKASYYSGAFFLTLSVGRLFGGYVLEKIGYMKGIVATIILAFISYSIGLMREELIILVSLSGLFFAIVFPTVMLVVQDLFKENVARVVAVVTMITSSVSMIFGYLIGYLNDAIGVKLSFYIMPGSLFIALAFMIVISGYIKVVKEKRIEGEVI